jgi:hypothetical protein
MIQSAPAQQSVPTVDHTHYPPDPLKPQLNHPKNYVAYALAAGLPHRTGLIVKDNITNLVGAARDGARQFGLVDLDGNLTDRGSTLCEQIASAYGTLEAAFTAMATLSGSSKRFTKSAPLIADLTRQHIGNHPLCHAIQSTLSVQDGSLRLPKLAAHLTTEDPEIAATHLYRSDTISNRAHTTLENDIQMPAFDDLPSLFYETDSYNSLLTFQLKTILCHLGIIATPGDDTASLTPKTQSWHLERPVWRGYDE